MKSRYEVKTKIHEPMLEMHIFQNQREKKNEI